MSIKFENTEVVGWEAAIRYLHSPMSSLEKSDTCFSDIECMYCDNCKPNICGCDMTKHYGGHRIGPNDLALMKQMGNLQMITVYVDITAPLYWWGEFDGGGTLDKILDKEFTLDDFSCERLLLGAINTLKETVDLLNYYRYVYTNYDSIKNGDIDLGRRTVENISKINKKELWWQIIQLLPSSYNQKRTVQMDYEILTDLYKSRKNDELDEWSVGFIEWIASLPYSELITG